MKKLFIILIFSWIVILHPVISFTSQNNPEEDAVRAVFNKYISSIRAADINAMFETVTNSADFIFMTVSGKIIEGTAAYRKYHEEWFAQKGWSIDFSEPNIFFTKESAYVISKFIYREINSAGETEILESWFTLILKKESGLWKITSDICTPISRKLSKPDPSKYLVPSERIDSDNPLIIQKSKELLKGVKNETEKVRILFEFVRDMKEKPDVPCGEDLKASDILGCGVNGCYGRSVLLAALCRSAGISARLHLQRVIIKDGTISESGKSDLQFGHLLTGIYVNGAWRIYETVGNDKKWRQWMGDYPVTGDATVHFRPDSDCLFTPNEKIIMEMIPKSFTGFNHILINEIIKIDGGIYL